MHVPLEIENALILFGDAYAPKSNKSFVIQSHILFLSKINSDYLCVSRNASLQYRIKCFLSSNIVLNLIFC